MDNTILKYLDQYYPAFDQDLKNIIAEKGTLRHFEAGDKIIRTGQYFQSTILIAKGRIKLYREGDDGNEFLSIFLSPAMPARFL